MAILANEQCWECGESGLFHLVKALGHNADCPFYKAPMHGPPTQAEYEEGLWTHLCPELRRISAD